VTQLLNDDSHCEGVVLQRSNNHACTRRDTCLRYTETMRKRNLELSDGWITHMTATDDCLEYLEVKQ
jgi:hypothetical protein